eukprot:5398808-Amphidinium_carterae.1
MVGMNATTKPNPAINNFNLSPLVEPHVTVAAFVGKLVRFRAVNDVFLKILVPLSNLVSLTDNQHSKEDQR